MIRADWGPATQRYYEVAADLLSRQFELSSFWRAFGGRLSDLDTQYLDQTRYRLRSTLGPPPVRVKSYESLVKKTFRRDVLRNPNWPKAPEGDWVTPKNVFSAVNDIVRTRVVVRYLDGVRLVIRALEEECATHGLRAESKLEARDYGYYGGHTNLWFDFEVPTIGVGTEVLKGRVEIQVSTDIKETIEQITHKYYERARRQPLPAKSSTPWQWEYEGSTFIVNYLGHILHYLEGMILEMRNRSQG